MKKQMIPVIMGIVLLVLFLLPSECFALRYYIVLLLESVIALGMVTFIVFLVHSMSWTYLSLGAVLILVGVIIPKLGRNKDDDGEFVFKIGGIDISLKGGCRFAAIAAGIVLISGSVYSGYAGAKHQQNSFIGRSDSLMHISYIGIDHSDSQEMGQSPIISNVLSSSPAFKAGVLVNDVIIKVDDVGASGKGGAWATDAVRKQDPDTVATLEVKRGNDTIVFRMLRIDMFEYHCLKDRSFAKGLNLLKTIHDDELFDVLTEEQRAQTGELCQRFIDTLEVCKMMGSFGAYSSKRMAFLQSFHDKLRTVPDDK